MFPHRYFPNRYFAPRYFPKVGATAIVSALKTITLVALGFFVGGSRAGQISNQPGEIHTSGSDAGEIK
jgi:hypothetical protein